ncbi:MAG: PilZ domain-containing protein [Betaproteobacteria bacterium]|nr:PilZ domain-containing protein [Betaproteobacteria bacterium]
MRAKKRKGREHRSEERVSASLPVKLGKKAKGVTRDVSASGAYIETDAKYAVGSPVRFAIHLDTPWGKVLFDCRGQIVRLEHRDGTVGVAVRFTETDRIPAASPAKRRR